MRTLLLALALLVSSCAGTCSSIGGEWGTLNRSWGTVGGPAVVVEGGVAAPTISYGNQDVAKGESETITPTTSGTISSCTVTSGSLSAGLTLGAAPGCAITGTPSVGGTSAGIVVTATGPGGSGASPSFSITVASIAYSPTEGVVSQSYSLSPTTTGTLTNCVVQTGTLPTGLSLGSAPGCAITGTPSAEQTQSGIVIRATTTGGTTDSASFSISTFGPDFQALTGNSGYANLSNTLTINSQTLTQVFRYDADDISGTNWSAAVGGVTLAEAGTGTSPTSGRRPPFSTSGERSVKYEGAKHHEGAVGDITTSDFCVEVVARVLENSGATTDTLVSKRDDGLTENGWSLGVNTSDQVTLIIDSGVTSSTATTTTAAAFGDSWMHIAACVDRNSATGMRILINGVVDATADGSTDSGTLTTGDPLRVGSRAIAGGEYTGDIAYLAMWTCSACLSTTASHYEDAFKERFQALTGVKAQVADGSAYPTTVTRASGAVLDVDQDDDGVVRLAQVHNGWPLFAARNDSAGTIVRGYRSEGQATNLALRSSELDNATWTKNAITSVTTNSTANPFQDTRADGLVANTTNTAHHARQSVSVTSGQKYVFSVACKAGNQSWCFVYFDGGCTDTGGVGRMWNVSTGTEGSTYDASVPTTSGIESLGGGWYRVWISVTATATTSCALYVGTGDEDFDGAGGTAHHFAGDAATVNTHFFGAQVEQRSDGHPSSPIPTTSATVTRTAATLTYSATTNYDETSGTIVAAFLDSATVAEQYHSIAGARKDADEYQHMWSNATGGACEAGTVGAGFTIEALITGTTDVTDYTRRTCAYQYASNDFELVVSGTDEGNDDTSGTPPTGITQIVVGHNGDDATQNHHGIISNVRLYSTTAARQ